jgi:hypothetical protein
MGCVSGPFHAYSVVLMLGCYSWYGWLAKGGGCTEVPVVGRQVERW